MKTIVVFTGAGISEESGIKTFRGQDGLWENYNINEVATPQAWKKNPELVLRFYNERRKQIIDAIPNDAHKSIVKLEEKFRTYVVTQNIDDLHERAGSKSVLHLHGEIKKARSTLDAKLIYSIRGKELNVGDKCEKGAQLRPHIVWFGEDVPEISKAASLIAKADFLIIVGTSLNVYPAAGLINYASSKAKIYLIDPSSNSQNPRIKIFREKACKALPYLINEILFRF